MDKLTKWLNSLLRKGSRKPQAATVVHLESAEEAKVALKKTKRSEEKKTDVEIREDSVTRDIKRVKTFTKKIVKKLEKVLGPNLIKTGKTILESISSIGEVIGIGVLKKIFGLVLVFVLLGVIVFVGFRAFKLMKKNEVEETLTQISPTPASYRPYKPSIYAQDPEVLKMQEDIDVLKREVSLTNISETTLNPPDLDFKIAF